MNWKQFWNDSSLVREKDPLRQVGKTVGGVPISAEKLDVIVHEVRHTLSLQADDILLDLCCGNGMLTSRLASYCSGVVGIDFSLPLLQTANIEFANPHITYELRDARQLTRSFLHEHQFTKVLMYEALQHFDGDGLSDILKQFEWLPRRPLLMLASVPDLRRKDAFLDSRQKRMEYERYVREGTDRIGQWWKAEEIVWLCSRHHYAVRILDQDPRLHGAHYRLDALCIPDEQRPLQGELGA